MSTRSRSVGSPDATRAVDWEQRIDFPRLRRDRLDRAKAALEVSDLGALLLFDPNNIRYVTSTHIGEWARDKNARFALLPVEEPHEKTSTVMPFGPYCLNPQCKVGTQTRVV